MSDQEEDTAMKQEVKDINKIQDLEEFSAACTQVSEFPKTDDELQLK